MKILLVHNSYLLDGGEDVVFETEKSQLLSAGHKVWTYTRRNHEIRSYNWRQKASLPLRATWAWDTVKELRKIIAGDRPDVAHFHNTFPLVSPAAYYVCREAGIPVVQTLHNPRLICPAATLHRNGHACEDCVGKLFAWPAVIHSCYRDSRAQSATVAAMLASHRLLKTWERLIDRYIVSTKYFAARFAAAGLPADRISVKNHFIARPHPLAQRVRDYALFVGRLAPEKGVHILLTAWKKLAGIPLKIRGDGPLLPLVQEHMAAQGSTIDWIPRLSREELYYLFDGARFLVWPSQGLYETFGLVAIEAFAAAVPVIASGAGAMAEVVCDGATGLHFKSGSAEDLASAVAWAWSHPNEMAAMGRTALAEYESKYTPERNYQSLMTIYRSAIENRNLTAQTNTDALASSPATSPGIEPLA